MASGKVDVLDAKSRALEQAQARSVEELGHEEDGAPQMLEQLLARLGITEEMVNNLKTQFQNVELEEDLNTAREYLKESGGKATTYAKENPGKVAAGVAALALGAGLIYATTRDK